jgi:hypothetical protein
VPFDTPKTTQNPYSGIVQIDVTGTGHSNKDLPSFFVNDAFYNVNYEKADVKYGLCINGMNAGAYKPNGSSLPPPYNKLDHAYSFTVDLYASSEILRNRYNLLLLGIKLHVPSSRVIPQVQRGSI